MPRSDEVTILLVEDDPGHARLIEKNLRRSSITNPIVNIADGQRTLDLLLGQAAAARAAGPCLILLDLNMPGMSGYQVLARLKEDERTRPIPIVVLTTTDDAAEIKKCYDLGCNAYITKPVDYEQFSEAIHRLGLFLTVVRMPDGQFGGKEPRH